MKLQEELSYLKGYIKLSERDAIKRNCLEQFLSTRNKIALLDADSLLYHVAYNYQDSEYVNELPFLVDRFIDYVNYIEEYLNQYFEIERIEYFFTTCTECFRYDLNPEYKANREMNRTRFLAGLLLEHVLPTLIENNEVVWFDKKLEADDLISKRSKKLGHKAIVCSKDKDVLKLFKGAKFNYLRVTDRMANKIELGYVVGDYIGYSYVTEENARYNLLHQLLTGDKSDNIKGAKKGIGIKTAKKLLKGKSEFVQLLTVARQYNDINRLRTNIKLMKL